MEANITKKMEITSKTKEAYFTATQTQLVKTRFFKNKSAKIAGSVLIFLIFFNIDCSADSADDEMSSSGKFFFNVFSN